MPAGDVKHEETQKWKEPAIRVAVVGVGYLGKFHVQKYAAIPGVEIVGLVDAIPERAKHWADKVGTNAWRDYQSLLGKVDAVSVAVPTHSHHAVAKDFLQAGCSVLLEKPIAQTLEDADDLIQTARQTGSVLQIGHVERFNPAMLAVAGKIHRPQFIECQRLTSFRDRGTDVGVVLDLMIHDLDIVLSWVGKPARHVQATGVCMITDCGDMANARIEFEDGCVANLTASRVSAEDHRHIQVFQGGEIYSLDFKSRKVTRRTGRSGRCGTNGTIYCEEIPVRDGDALEMEIREFIRSCRERTVPIVTGEDGRKALAFALAIQEKLQTQGKLRTARMVP